MLEKVVEGTVLRQGELARITLRLEIPAAVQLDDKVQLLIQDYIPTGMRYESMGADTGWSKVAQDDQRVSFAAHQHKAEDLVFTHAAPCWWKAPLAAPPPAAPGWQPSGSWWRFCPEPRYCVKH